MGSAIFLPAATSIIKRNKWKAIFFAIEIEKSAFDIEYIDEIGNKYANKSVQNAERAGAKTLKDKKILQIPKQETSIPKDILDYADEAKVTIQEIKDVTMEMLKTW